MGLVGTHSGWTPRRAGLQNTHGSCARLPANEIFPSSEPWGLKVWDTKANANTASLLGKADTGSFPEEHPSCFHTTFSSLSEREGRTQCSQTWHAIAIHNQFYLHLLGSDAVQELANPDGPLITQLTAPALLEGGCFETQSLPWIESILASCVSARHAACWFYPNKELRQLRPFNYPQLLYLLWSYWILYMKLFKARKHVFFPPFCRIFTNVKISEKEIKAFQLRSLYNFFLYIGTTPALSLLHSLRPPLIYSESKIGRSAGIILNLCTALFKQSLL